MDSAGLSIAIVGDDAAHGVLGRGLVDAVLSERGASTGHRSWWLDGSGASDLKGRADGYYRAKGVRVDLRAIANCPSGRPLYLRRRREGQIVTGDSAFDDVFQLFGLLGGDGPDLIVMLRDTDGDTDRQTPRAPILDELDPSARPRRMVVGLPHPEAEAWFIVSMAAPDPDRLAAIRKARGFDPTTAPERLRSDGQGRDAKRALQFLTCNADSLEQAPSTPLPREELEALLDGVADRLDDLRRRGDGCGLSAFLLALARDLASLDDGAPHA